MGIRLKKEDIEVNVKITETVLRDANQSLMATRLPEKDFDAILETMDQAGFDTIECWGGATFDSCLRYLNEDPWERLRTIRSKVKNTKLSMLFRGQNLLGYHHYSDDTVSRFVKKSVENGIDIIRIFDALNDTRNMRTAVDACLEAGGHAQGALCFTSSPVHSLKAFAELGKQIEAMGCQSLCVKDMAGIMSPKEAYDLVKTLKESVSIPVVVHTHATTGLGSMTCLKAVEAGADGIDTAISCFSGGTSQPPTESLVYTLEQFGYQTGVDFKKLKEINDFFVPVKNKYMDAKVLDPYVMGTKADALTYQIPGGMLSNLVAQLKAQNAIDRLEEVLAETPKVRADLGYPPLVTPMSQMVGVQAATNVLLGERYKNISKEIKSYIRGEYGKAPGPINKDLAEKVLAGQSPIKGRYAESLPAEFEEAKAHLGSLAESEEDVLSYIAFPAQAEAFFDYRAKKREEEEFAKALVTSYSIQEVK